MKIYLMITLLCLLIKPVAYASILDTSDPFGKSAAAIEIDVQHIAEPKLSKTGKAYVTDGFGFDVFLSESNWVNTNFLSSLTSDMVVMDVGSGYWALTRNALGKVATVISNDIADNQHLYNLKKIACEHKSRLYLNSQDIRRLRLPDESLDAIVFHRVLHFFNGFAGILPLKCSSS